MSMLINTMDPQIACLCMLLNSSKAIWDKVKQLHGQQQNFAHVFNLKHELSQNKQGGKTSSQYGTEVLTRWEELQLYLPPTTDLDEIRRRAEQDLIYTYLGGLNLSYEAIRSQILCSTELPSINSVMPTIQREETKLHNMNNPDIIENKAYAAARNPNPIDAAKTKGTTAADWCDHCKRSGHNQEGYWVLYPHLRPARRNGERSNWGGGRKGCKEQKYGGMAKRADEEVRSEPINVGHTPSEASRSSVAQSTQLTELLN